MQHTWRMRSLSASLLALSARCLPSRSSFLALDSSSPPMEEPTAAIV